MNPTQISPNAGRTFVEGSRYWLREEDGFVMPRENSRYEAPNGFIPVMAKSETELVHDNSGLDKVPANVDPTNPQHVGAAVSHFGNHQMETHDPAQGRPMPVTMPNAMDDHNVRKRSLKALAEQASVNTSTAEVQAPAEDAEDEAPAKPTRRSSRRTKNA